MIGKQIPRINNTITKKWPSLFLNNVTLILLQAIASSITYGRAFEKICQNQCKPSYSAFCNTLSSHT